MPTTGPDFVSLQVRDLEASARFYEEVVGLARVPAPNPGAAIFQAGDGVAFAVREPFPGVDLDAAPLGVGVGIWFHADDVPGLHVRLVDHGAPVVQEPVDGPFGLQLAFQDPDGYVITAHSRA
ncbi:VOC family protein [Luteimicrobium sp. NPDC057192]|uniref:VOC family protein n=1 Tax=Luteimicrobium sp. NPDC057192 TaxID=3346042 RepID=UPI0036366367